MAKEVLWTHVLVFGDKRFSNWRMCLDHYKTTLALSPKFTETLPGATPVGIIGEQQKCIIVNALERGGKDEGRIRLFNYELHERHSKTRLWWYTIEFKGLYMDPNNL